MWLNRATKILDRYDFDFMIMIMILINNYETN